MRRLALLLCLLCAVASAAPPSIDIPAEIRPAGQYVTLEPKTEAVAITYIGLSGIEPIPSVVLKDPRMFLLDTRGLPAGRYKFVAVGSLKDEHKRVDFQVVIGDVPPGPVPPGPTPPGPNPPVPSGKRVLLLVHESSDDVPEVARMIVGLRSGPAADYLKSKGHELSILDVDDKNADGSPSYLVEAWRPHLTGMVLPALFVLDEDGKNLIHKQNVPMNSTANNVLDIVKGHGG